MRRLVHFMVLAAAVARLCGPGVVLAQDGIYADVQTSMGSFTCRLDYAIAPKAVANFIGLATGQRAWLDLTNGVVKSTPFFNNTSFHRVISNFVVQAGSRNGLGTDDPGYSFVDEFDSSARFNKFGVLAMANSGADSNGAQFFITMSPATWLNNGYTIFGLLVGGSNVVYAINRVATDPSTDKPKTNVVIENVGIRRVGGNAQAFNIQSQELPIVTNVGLNLMVSSTQNVSVSFTNLQYAHNRLFTSTNLTGWAEKSLGIELAATVTNRFPLTNQGNTAFYRLAQVQYSGTTLAPGNFDDRLLTLEFDNGVGTLKITFDSSGSGTYKYTSSQGNLNGALSSYLWTQQAFRGRLEQLDFAELVDMSLVLSFSSPTQGTVRGTAYGTTPFEVTGKFTLSGG